MDIYPIARQTMRKEGKSLANTPLTANRVFEELKKCGITHIVGLPDSTLRFLFDPRLFSQYQMVMVPVCREGEAIAIATGLQLGGQKPVVMHDNCGFFESGDSVRGLALDLKLPLLLIIGYRGWKRDALFTDSAGIFLEPILDAWGIKHYLVATGEDVARISIGYKEAHKTDRPVAILMTRGDSQP